MPKTPSELRPATGVAQYLQLASLLRHRIAQGALPAGSRLPNVIDMAAEYGIARITVRQAYAVLVGEGLITSRSGQGTYVAHHPGRADTRPRLVLDGAIDHDLHFDILDLRRQVPLPAALQRGGTPYPDYFHIRKVHVEAVAPFCLAEIYVATEIHACFPAGAERDHKIAWLLKTHAPANMQSVRQTLTVMPADTALARWLDCSFGAPVVCAARWVLDTDDRIATAGLFWYRGDRFVADTEIPFDIWKGYPTMIIPEADGSIAHGAPWPQRP